MKNYIYVLFNTLSKRYESVMSFPSDGMALHRLQQNNIDTKEYELCRIGSYDIENGAVDACTPVHLVWENNTVLPKSEA